MAGTEAHLPTSRRAAARKALLSPVNLIPFPVLAVLASRRHYHFVADNPLWLLLGAMVVTQVFTTADRGDVSARHDQRAAALCSSPRRSCSSVSVCTSNGWGALLAVGFVFAAATVDPLRRLAVRAGGRWPAPRSPSPPASSPSRWAGSRRWSPSPKATGWRCSRLPACARSSGFSRTTSARKSSSKDRCGRASGGSAHWCSTPPTSFSLSRPTGP